MNMKKAIFNIFLIIALAAVILMVVGIFLYDYIPSSSTVKDINIYETSSDVTKIIAEIDDAKSSLGVSTDSSNSTSTGTKGLVLKTYSITETDLAIYSATGSYNSGKSDPFADVSTSSSESDTSTSTSSTSGNTTTSSSSTSSNTTSSSTSTNTTSSTSSTTNTNTSDGTLFNSTSSK